MRAAGASLQTAINEFHVRLALGASRANRWQHFQIRQRPADPRLLYQRNLERRLDPAKQVHSRGTVYDLGAHEQLLQLIQCYHRAWRCVGFRALARQEPILPDDFTFLPN